MSSRVLIVLAAVVAMLALPAGASAAPNTWQGDSVTDATDWTDGANWSDGAAPDATDDVIIPATNDDLSDVVIQNIDATATVASFTLQASAGTAQSLTSVALTSNIRVLGAFDVRGGDFNSVSFTLAAGSDSAIIGDGAAESANLDNPLPFNTFEVEAGRTLEIASSPMNAESLEFGNLIVDPGAAVSATGDFYLEATNVDLSGALDIEGQLRLLDTTISGATTSISADAGSELTAENVTFSGSMSFDADLDLTFIGGQSEFQGSSYTLAGDTVLYDTTIVVAAMSVVTVPDSGYVVVNVGSVQSGFIAAGAASLVLDGIIEYKDVDPAVVDGVFEFDSTVNDAAIFINDGLTVSTGGRDMVIDEGQLEVVDGSTFVADAIDVTGTNFSNDGYVAGIGTVDASVTIGDGGIVQPYSDASGFLEVTDLDITADGRLSIRITSPTVHGRLLMDGTNDGTLVVNPWPDDDYAPPVGTVFTVVGEQSSDVVDLAADIDSRQLGGGLYVTQALVANQLVLTTRQASVVSASGGYPGGSVTVVGSGYVPGETVSVEVYEGMAGAFGTVVADGSGAYSLAVPLSTQFTAGGTLFILANGSISGVNVIGGGTLGAAPTCAVGQTGTPPNCVDPVKEVVTPRCNDAAEVFRGGPGAQRFRGCGGEDRFFGLDGADVFYGDAGNDRGIGGAGNDYLNGGSGNDRLVGGTGRDRIFGLTGDDVLFGGMGNDVVSGGRGDDIVRGGSGNDSVLCGGDDKDVAYGEAGNDFVSCRDRKAGDTISGGAGIDTCFGDRGDRFLGCERILRA